MKYNTYKRLTDNTLKHIENYFFGYQIEESYSRNVINFLFIKNDDFPFHLHYELLVSKNSIISDYNDAFSKKVVIYPRVKLQSPDCIYTIEVEIPQNHYIDKGSVSHGELLLSNLNDGNSVIWVFQISDISDFAAGYTNSPFEFVYSKNEKLIATNLMYLNIFLFILGICIILYTQLSKVESPIKLSFYPLLAFVLISTLLPLFLGQSSEFWNIFFYSKAHLLLFFLVVITLYQNKYALRK